MAMPSFFSSSRWTVHESTPDDLAGIRALFRSVFGKELSVELWDWRYGGGRGHSMVVCEGDQVVAHFGGTERRSLMQGRPVVALQCGDSMVAEAHRGTLSRKGPFYRSVTAFLEKYVGYDRQYVLTYGFANLRAMALAERLGVYAHVGDLVEVSWNPRATSPFGAVEVDFDSAIHQHELARLWQAMAADFPARFLGVRDAAYLKHRFHEHPSQRYDILLVSGGDDPAPLGVLVTRQDDGRLWLIDLMGPRSSFPALIRHGRALAAQRGCAELYGWLTAVDRCLLEGTDPRVGEVIVRLPLSVHTDSISAAEVRDKWFFLCGDTDFL